MAVCVSYFRDRLCLEIFVQSHQANEIWENRAKHGHQTWGQAYQEKQFWLLPCISAVIAG